MASAPVNPDVPSTVFTPFSYIYLSTAPIISDTDLPKDVLIVAPYINSTAALVSAPYNLTPGTATPNTIEQYTSLTRVNQAFGRRSMAAQLFRAVTQEVPIGLNVYIAAIQEPTNSGFAGVATGLLTLVGTAVGSGEIKVTATGHAFQIPVATGDSATTMVGSAKSAMDVQTQDAQLVSTTAIDHQLPQITFTGNATAGSNITIVANGITKLVAIAGADTPTLAAGKVVTALVADTAFPVTASNVSGVVSLTWRSGFVPATLTISYTDATQSAALTYLTSGASTGATLPFTYVHRGETGNDKGVIVEIPPEITGVKVSPGSITIATNAGGSGSIFTLKVGSQELPIAIAGGTTPANSAIAIAAAINAATFPVFAESAGATVTLYHRNGWVVHRIQIKSTEAVAGQTYTLYSTHDSAGGITSVSTVAGTATYTGLGGAGVPVLTTFISNRAKLAAFQEWVVNFVDATSLTAIFNHITTYGNGNHQQGQRFEVCDSRDVETVRGIVTSTTPYLSTPPGGWRPTVMVCQDCPMPAVLIAGQFAARLCADDLPYNQDGVTLAQGGTSPMLPPRAEVDLDPVTADTAMRSYLLTPVRGNRGQVQVIRGVSTWGETNREWSDLSYGRMFDEYRHGLGLFLTARFAGKVLFVGTSEIRVDNAFTLDDVRAACNEYNESQNGIIVDGAESLAETIVVERDPDDATRIRIGLRLRVPREIHIMTTVVSGTA